MGLVMIQGNLRMESWHCSVLLAPSQVSICQTIGRMMPTGMYPSRFGIIIMFTGGRWVYMRGFVMDGNFSAEHMAMKNPEDDVSLGDGAAFMVGTAEYKAHLAVASEDHQVRARAS